MTDVATTEPNTDNTPADIQPSHHWPPAPIGTTIATAFGGGVVAGDRNLPSNDNAIAAAAETPALGAGIDPTTGMSA